MSVAFARSPSPDGARAILQRTHGRSHPGMPVTRLMSPSDLGQILKPFVFLDHIDHEGPAFDGGLHPHSGIATLTYIADGAITYIDPDGHRGRMEGGSVEWMQAGRGMWHGGGMDAGHISGFQLWIALPADLELAPARSMYLDPEQIPDDGPARVLLGTYGSAASPIPAPSPVNYLAVRLSAGESWRYVPPAGHSVLWMSGLSGRLSAPADIGAGEMVIFEPSEQPVTFTAETDAEFVLGSAAPHGHELAVGNYSVHTSPDALQAGEQEIAFIGERLRREGRR